MNRRAHSPKAPTRPFRCPALSPATHSSGRLHATWRAGGSLRGARSRVCIGWYRKTSANSTLQIVTCSQHSLYDSKEQELCRGKCYYIICPKLQTTNCPNKLIITPPTSPEVELNARLTGSLGRGLCNQLELTPNYYKVPNMANFEHKCCQ